MMKVRLLCAALLMTATLAHAATWSGQCQSEYAVKATVDSFTGKAASEPFTIEEGADQVVVEVVVDKMETGKKKRDKEMQHMFHADVHPVIRGTASAAALQNLAPDANGQAEIPFTLEIAGVKQELVAKVSKLVTEGSQRTFDAAFEVSVKSFGLKTPSIMGLIRVNDIVKVTSHFTLENK